MRRRSSAKEKFVRKMRETRLKRRARGLLILLAKDREVDVALGVRLEVDEERVGTLERTVEVVIDTAVVEEEAKSIILAREFAVQVGRHAVELIDKLLRIGQGIVDTLHGAFHVDGRQIA